MACSKNYKKLEEIQETRLESKDLIPRKELQLDSNLLVELLKNVKRLQSTSSIIFTMTETDTSRTQEFINQLQIILENQATKDDPFNVLMASSNDTDVFTSTLFPAAIRTAEQLMQIFYWGDSKAEVNLETISQPKFYTMRLCTYPHLLKSIILTMASLLMVYRGIGYAYSAHNVKLRQQVQKSHKADVLLDPLTHQSVLIDKTFQTAFLPTYRAERNKSKLAPLVPLYVKLTDYLRASLRPDNNKKLQRVHEMFQEAAQQLEQYSKGVPAKIVRRALDPNDIEDASDPKLAAVDNFVSMLLSSSDIGLRDPFRGILPTMLPGKNISSASGKNGGNSGNGGEDDTMNCDDEDINDHFNQELLEAAGSASYIPDFFERMQTDENFMCSSLPQDEAAGEDEDELEEEEAAAGGSDSSSSSSSEGESSSSSEDESEKKKKKKREEEEGVKKECVLQCKIVGKKKHRRHTAEKKPDPWTNGDDDDDNGFFSSFAGADAPQKPSQADKDHVQEVLEDLAKEVSNNLGEMDNVLGQVSSTTLTKYLRAAYKKLNQVVRIINNSLLTTEKTFVTDMLRTRLADKIRETNSGSLFEEDELEDEEEDEATEGSLNNVRRRISDLYTEKLPMLLFLKENIQQTLDYIRREAAEFALLESKLIARALVTDAAAQRVYDAMTANPRYLIQLALPVRAIPLIYQLNMNQSIVPLYTAIADSIIESRVLLQLNALMLVPIEYYLLGAGGNSGSGYFDNKGLFERYKHTYSAVLAKMFDYAVSYSALMFRQQVQGPTATTTSLATAPRLAEKMMIKNGDRPATNSLTTSSATASSASSTTAGPKLTSVISGSLGSKKFDFIKNTSLVEKELAAKPHDYIECITAITSGLSSSSSAAAVANSSVVARTSESASMFMLTNFIYSLDIFILLNLIGVQLKLVSNVDQMIDLIYGHLEYMLGESASDGDTEGIPKMFETPVLRLLASLIVLNPRSPTANPLHVADARLYSLLDRALTQKPKWTKALEMVYNLIISSSGMGEILVTFGARRNEQKVKETEEFTVKPEFYDKMFKADPAAPPLNLLDYVEMTNVKRRESVGQVEPATEFSSLSSNKATATLVDHLIPKCAFLASLDWLNCMVGLTLVSPVANNMSFQLTPAMYQTQALQFKITS
ncbi:MAG: hypothetical protein E6Q06_02085 [Candidatus Moraniibacteriota bacterium]|nr:MAG: hypothetical protein E6Q06_02085 [Candidatus Moranbacteria bacterium]